MTTRTILMPRDSQELPLALRQPLRHAALRRNLRTAAVLGIAASGAALSTTALAATAGSTFLVMAFWRYRQLRQPGPTAGQRSSTLQH